MNVIFKDIFGIKTFVEILAQHKTVKTVTEFIKNNKALTKLCSLTLIGMLAVGVTIVSVGITLGLNVNYGGSVIATVSHESVFEDAKNIALGSIESENADKAIKTPSFKMTLTVSNRLDNATHLANAIIKNTNDIVETTVLKVNGENLICADTNDLEACLNKALSRYDTEGAENASEFVSELSTEKCYSVKSDIASADELEEVIMTLDVKTVSVVNTDTVIPYSEKTVKTSKEYIGYKKVTTEGENGISRKTETVEKLNGVELIRTEISDKIVKQPVTKVTTVGTAKSLATPAERSEERSQGFICPLKRSSFTISSYYGDGRNHKGMDLAADKGTPIYASAAGVVESAFYDGAYGYSIVLNHSNGYKTRYSHNSALCVKNGQTVEQGEVIAYVGSTGRSTGNHLHFEIVKNGNRVNPASYIGLD